MLKLNDRRPVNLKRILFYCYRRPINLNDSY